MLNQLLQDITDSVKDLNHISKIIGSCYSIIVSLPNSELQKVYAKESLVFINDYKDISKALERKLETYFELEAVNNTPVNFELRRLYKTLQIEKK